MATTKVPERYSEIKNARRGVQEPLVDPEALVLDPTAPPAAVNAKPPLRLDDLYPHIEEYRTISTARWTSLEVMEEEWDKLWTHTWVVAGRASDAAGVGDWFTFDLGRESIVVVRSSADAIRAFYNVCRHRGNRLVRGDFGTAAKCFTCSFHAWTYGVDGRNLHVSDRKTFSPEALKDGIDLTEVHCRVWGGFVFVNMADDPQPFEDYLGEILRFMAPYRMEDMCVVKDVEMPVPANWKTTMDAFQEMYHVHETHAQALTYVEDHFGQYDFYANGHNRMLVPLGRPSPRWPDREGLNPMLAYLLKEVGVDPATFGGTAADVRRAIQQAKRRPDNAFGMDYGRFVDDQLTDDWNVTLFPNTTLNAHPEGVLVQRFRPHPRDPEQSFYDVMVICARMKPGMRPPAYMGVEPEVDVSGAVRPPRRRTTIFDPQMGEVLEQDANNIPQVQLGIHSRGLRGRTRYSEQERRIQQFYAEIDLYLTGRKRPAAARKPS